MNHLYEIKDKDGEKVTFKANRAQKEFKKAVHNRNIILKSRQLGFTTLETIDTLDDVLFNRNLDAILIAQDLDTAKDIFKNKVYYAWKNIPEGIRNLWKQEIASARQIRFDFGDGTESSITVDNTGRSGTFRRVHVSELPILHDNYPDRAKEVMTGTIPAVPMGGRVDIEGTAKGEKGHFYEIFWDAWERGDPTNPSEWKAHFYNWTYDEAEISKIKKPKEDIPKEFKDIQKKHGLTGIQITYYYYKWLELSRDWDALFQEYPTSVAEAFIYAGDKVFSHEKLEFQEQFEKSGQKLGNWIIYEDYDPSHRYAIGADVGEGIGRDASAAIVIDFMPLVPRVVAEYANNHIQPDNFAYELREMAERYGSPIVAVERNQPGFSTITKLKEIYNNIYREEREDKSSGVKTKRYGWNTTLSTKPKMIYDLNTALNEDAIKIPSKYILREMRSFSQEELSKVKEDEGQTRHFDRVIALAIAYQMKDKIKQKTKTKVSSPNWKGYGRV